MIGVWNRSVIITYVGVAVAVVGIRLAASGGVRGSLVCLVVAGVCDLFDGPVARRVRRDREARRFGVEIDSLADAICFVALPIVIAYALGARSPWCVPVLVGYALAGLIRLAAFNTLAGEPADTRGHYRGLPVTYAALLFPLAALASPLLPRTGFVVGYTALMLAMAVSFLLDVPVRKPGGRGYAVLAMAAVVMVVALALVEV